MYYVWRHHVFQIVKQAYGFSFSYFYHDYYICLVGLLANFQINNETSKNSLVLDNVTF